MKCGRACRIPFLRLLLIARTTSNMWCAGLKDVEVGQRGGVHQDL